MADLEAQKKIDENINELRSKTKIKKEVKEEDDGVKVKVEEGTESGKK